MNRTIIFNIWNELKQKVYRGSHSLLHNLLSSQSSVANCTGVSLMTLPVLFAANLNLLTFILDKKSKRKLSVPLMCLAKTLKLYSKLLKVNFLMRTIQNLQLEEELFIILTTASLSQCIINLLFLSRSDQTKTLMHRAYSSKNSMDGSLVRISCLSHCEYSHSEPKTLANPISGFALVSLVNLRFSAVS